MSTNSGAKKMHWPFVDIFFVPGTATNLKYIRSRAKKGAEHMRRALESCNLFLKRRFLASVIDAIVFPIFPGTLEPIIVGKIIAELSADRFYLKQILIHSVPKLNRNTR